MRSKLLTLVAAAIATVVTAGCTHDSAGGRGRAMMANAGDKDCAMRGRDGGGHGGPKHERETAQRAHRGDKNMSGCRMMGGAKEAPHVPEARDPHSDHRP